MKHIKKYNDFFQFNEKESFYYSVRGQGWGRGLGATAVGLCCSAAMPDLLRDEEEQRGSSGRMQRDA